MADEKDIANNGPVAVADSHAMRADLPSSDTLRPSKFISFY